MINMMREYDYALYEKQVWSCYTSSWKRVSGFPSIKCMNSHIKKMNQFRDSNKWEYKKVVINDGREQRVW